MSQYGMIVDVDKCIGCQACFVACKEENKVAPGIQWNQIHRIENPTEMRQLPALRQSGMSAGMSCQGDL